MFYSYVTLALTKLMRAQGEIKGGTAPPAGSRSPFTSGFSTGFKGR